MATRSGTRLTVTLEGESFAAASGANGAVASIALRGGVTRAQGTSANNVDKVFQANISVGTAAVDYDLSGGSNVKDPASQADQTFTKLHAIIVINTHASQNLILGGDTNSVPFLSTAASTITIGPGGIFAWDFGADGVAVTAGTGDIVQIEGSGSATTGVLTLIGR